MAERERDLDRFLTFIDAVVAIAITLLVLPLAEIGKEAQTGDVGELLREHANDMLGFFLSFIVIARLWLVQHDIVSGLVRQSPAVVRLLLAWSLTIVFLPFPTTLVTGTTNDTFARVIYIGTMPVSSALLALIALVVSRDRSLLDTDTVPDAVHTAAVTIGFLLALAISVVFPPSSYWPLLLLLLADPIVNRLRRGRGAAT